MLALGVILIVVAAAVIVAAVAGASDQSASFDLGAFSVEMDTRGVFLAGAATVVLLGIGLVLLRSGIRRANRRRKDKKELNRLAQELQAREAGTKAHSGSSATTEAPGHAPPETTRVETVGTAEEPTSQPPPSSTGGEVREQDRPSS